GIAPNTVPTEPARGGGPDQYDFIKGPRAGDSVQSLDPNINPRLGCALAVSAKLHAEDPSIPITNNNAQLEAILHKKGYELVPHKGPICPDQLQKGDVLIGKRPNGMPGHAAVYEGNGKVFENDSNTGKMREDGSLDKFNRGMHDEKGNWNKNGFE